MKTKFFFVLLFAAGVCAGCSMSTLHIQVVGPDLAPLPGLRISGDYQTRKAPEDKIPASYSFDMTTNENGIISISAHEDISGVELSIQSKRYNDCQAIIQGFPGAGDKGFELKSVAYPYGVVDVKNLDPFTIRFRLDVR